MYAHLLKPKPLSYKNVTCVNIQVLGKPGLRLSLIKFARFCSYGFLGYRYTAFEKRNDRLYYFVMLLFVFACSWRGHWKCHISPVFRPCGVKGRNRSTRWWPSYRFDCLQ